MLHAWWAATGKRLRPGPRRSCTVANLSRDCIFGDRRWWKAVAGMVAGLELAMHDCLDRVSGIVNVPNTLARPGSSNPIHASRPAGANQPTEAAAGRHPDVGTCGPSNSNDAAIVLLSGGGLALLPAPADGITLNDKIEATRLLSGAGAWMNPIACQAPEPNQRWPTGRATPGRRHSDYLRRGDCCSMSSRPGLTRTPRRFATPGKFFEVYDLLDGHLL